MKKSIGIVATVLSITFLVACSTMDSSRSTNRNVWGKKQTENERKSDSRNTYEKFRKANTKVEWDYYSY